MDDDIDIEEHDVLDNPRIRNLLPDLSCIKTEIPDIEYEDDKMEYEPYEENQTGTQYEQYGSKIVLGSKPEGRLHITESEVNGESVLIFGRTIKEEAPDPEDEETPQEENRGEVNETFSSVLILGSKPSSSVDLNAVKGNESLDHKNVVSSDIDDLEMQKIKSAVVCLEDWGPRLQDSPCFCKDCEILFPTINTLLAHNMTAHSFLVAVETNKAMKSTSKTTKKTDSGKFCNHCDVMFPDSDSLINHLYENLQFDTNNLVFKSPEASTSTTAIQKVQDKLKPISSSEFYCCKVCFYYFRSFNNIAIHLSSNHAIGFEQVYSEEFNPRCRFCSAMFSSVKTYNEHIRLSHKTEYNQIVDVSKEFKCILCQAVLSNYAKARKHRKMFHPDTKDVSIFSQIKSQKATEDKLPPNPFPLTQKAPVPKSVLFQCRKCSVSFISCTAANLHAKACRNVEGEWACHICNRYFNLQNKNQHLLQHQVSSERFNVYLSGDDTLGRVLNKCPDCNAYFHENSFTRHCNSVCKGETVTCTLCELDIHSLSIEEHYKWHDKLNISDQNEFIIVEFAEIDSEKIKKSIADVPKPVPVKRKNEEVSNTIAKKFKIDDKTNLVKVYYCDKCGVSSLYRGKLHFTGECRMGRGRIICKICGLTFSSNKHKFFHKSYPKLTIMDMHFVRIDTLKPVVPAMPPFPKCNKCNVHFCTAKSVALHDCKDAHKTCKKCNKLYSDLAFKLHLNFHRLASTNSSLVSKPPEKAKKTITNLSSVAKRPMTQTPSSDQISELIQKYEKLSDLWNILYRCADCNIIQDSYDKAVEHSQKHFNNMEKHGVIVKNCKICDLKFDWTCFNKHKELHAQNESISKKSFKIIAYRYRRLLTPLWMKSLKVQLAEMEQIVARSIYSSTRRVKMRVVQDGAPESTLFKCCKCQHYVHSTSVLLHFQNHPPNQKTTSYDCEFCNIPFLTESAKNHHMALHKKFNHFKIVHFNEEGDDAFNKKLRRKKSKPTPNKINYFKCNNCKQCLLRRDSAQAHRCSELIKPCDRCGLYFHCRSSFKVHQQMHKACPQLNTKCITITGFIPASKSATKRARFFSAKQSSGTNVVSSKSIPTPSRVSAKESHASSNNKTKLYKCSCGLHFTSESTAAKHIKVCVEDANVTREECSKCGRLFDTTQLVTHLCKHHSGDNKTQFTIIEVKPQNKMKSLLRQCEKCDIYYLSQGGLHYHETAGHQKTKVETCTYCNLKFMPLTLAKHMLIHHKARKPQKIVPAQKQCFSKVKKIKSVKQSKYSFTGNYLKTINMKRYSNKLYECVTCKAHFLTKGSWYWHSGNEHFKVLDYCEICEYGFSEMTLSKHKYIHHEQMKLKREELVVVTSGAEVTKTKTHSDSSENKTEEDAAEANTAEEEKSGIMTAEDSEEEVDVTTVNEISVDETVNRGVDDNSQAEDEDSETMNTDNIEDNTILKGYTAHIKTRNLLFKCGLCDQYFLNENTVLHHLTSIHVRKSIQYKVETCNICNFNFPSTTFKRHMYLYHEKQNVSKSDFFIIIMKLCNGVITSNYIFRCGTCFTCFNRYSILLEHKNHSLEKVPCKKCGFEFSPMQLPKHKQMHDPSVNYKREDFVVLELTKPNELSIVSPESLGKFEVQPDQPVEVKEYNYSQDYITSQVDVGKYTKLLYKCCDCDLHCTHFQTLIKHRGTCGRETVATVDCSVCGLKFAVATVVRHKYAHHEKMGLKLEDFEIITLGKSAETANESIDSDNVDRSSILDASSVKSEVLDQSGPSNDSGHVPIRLTKLVRSQIDLNNYNNFLYKCSKCAVHFVHRSSLNTHIRKRTQQDICKHVNKVTCSLCGLCFSKLSLAKYVYIHHENFKLRLEDFRILDTEAAGLTYRPEPETPQKEPDLFYNILFRCTKCKLNFMKITTLKDHIPYCFDTHKKTTCHECGLLFTFITFGKHFKEHHGKLGLKIDDFKIMNEHCEVINESNEVIDKEDAQSETRQVYEDDDEEMTNKSDISKTTSSSKTDKYSEDMKCLFRCRICGSHYMKFKSVVRHIVDCKNTGNTTTTTKNCEYCGLQFSFQSLGKHRRLHHDEMKLTLGDMTVYNEFFEVIKPKDSISADLTNNDEPKELTANIHTLNKSLYTNILYRCNICQLHYLTEDSLDWHMSLGKHNVRKYQCTTCGLSFTIECLPTHIFIHHEKLAFTKKDFIVKAFGNITENSAIPNEATDKSVDADAESSVSQESSDVTTAKLNEENHTAREEIAVNSSLDKNDTETAESSNKSTDADSNVVSLESTSTQHKKDSDSDLIKLYKCGECNVCYVAQSTCYKHILKHKPLEPEDYIECKICGYQFLIFKSLHRHMSLHHHNKNFQPENVLIEEYHPNILVHGSPKIQIYRGSDKVQSKQVSTTCDVVKNSDNNDIEMGADTSVTEERLDNVSEGISADISEGKFADVSEGKSDITIAGKSEDAVEMLGEVTED